MATEQEQTKELERLSNLLDQFGGISTEQLVRPELGAELNFEKGRPFFDRTISLFRKLKNFDISDVPHSVLNSLAGKAEQALGEFKKIQEFTLQKYPNDPQKQRDSFINQIRDSYDEYYRVLTPQLAYFVRKESDIDELEQKARNVLDEISRLRIAISEELLRARSEAQSILETMRRAAAETGVSQHAIFFKEEAVNHENLARNWLKAIVGLGIVTVAAAAAFIIWPQRLPENFSTPQSIQLAIAKIILFSVLFFGITLSSRVYRAHRHNGVLNRHRYNALMTFQAFVKGTDDDVTKNAVLLRSTETIFSPSVSGFTSGESESGSYPQILEVIKSVTSQK